jgi:hypothetical protein
MEGGASRTMSAAVDNAAMHKARLSKPAIGGLAGFGCSVGILLAFWVGMMECEYKRKAFYYEGYLFREECRKEGKSDLQAATERYRIIHNQPNFQPAHHPDVKSGHPEAFIRGTLGYELRDGFGYGRKPGRLETFFELNTLKDTRDIMAMLRYFPYIAMLVSPLIGVAAGWLWSVKESRARVDSR